MKTLIFQGSPRKKGNTSYMVEQLCRDLRGEIEIISMYDQNIRPCIDCRYCFTHEGCAIQDDMKELYRKIEECDHIFIASPVYFEELTGVMLSVFSRLQTYFSARYIRKTEPISKKKTGGILLSAGSIGPQGKPQGTAELLLRTMGCQSLGTVYAGHTDRVPVSDQHDVLRAIQTLAKEVSGHE